MDLVVPVLDEGHLGVIVRTLQAFLSIEGIKCPRRIELLPIRPSEVVHELWSENTWAE